MKAEDTTNDREYKAQLEVIRSHIKFEPPPSAGLPEWRTYPDIPSSEDLNPDWENPEHLEKIHSLLPNNWQEPFPDKNTYLETHYRLQREEAVSILRFSVKKYREDATMVDDNETCIYTKVYVQGYLLTRLGPMCRIRFSTERAQKKIRWTQTRRLTPGSLVVVSTAKDGFRTICIPAVIADRPMRDGKDQLPPTVQIFWSDTADAILDPTIELVMLESRSGYFEAVRHCMVGLQHVAATATPLDKYLVNLDKSDRAAQYVQEDPFMNLRSLVHHIPGSSTLSQDAVRQGLSEVREPLTKCQILDGINDRISPYTNLDNSQLSAVHRILTKELSIIQGPPGTGKTFTSLQALQILLDSQKERGRNVVVVAAQTNHAVDQILIQLINLGFNTVRLGGRTQNEDIKRYNMYNLRRRAMAPRTQKTDKDHKAFEAALKKNISRLTDIVESMFSGELMDPQVLRAEGIITQQQLESLQAEDGWSHASSDVESSDLLSQWLGDQRIEAVSIDALDPDFDILESDDTGDCEEGDFDMELDDCIAEEDEKSGHVHGKWVPIKHQWTGANPRKYTEADLVIRRELKRDNLWDIGIPYRGAIYQFWQRELLRRRCDGFRAELAANVRICKNLKINRWQRDLICMKMTQIEIVGCTTTGLCKYRGLLSALGPRTMLIEEAAETKEASILSALYPSLQQLILVGDHQQLAPYSDTPLLDEAPYYIRVSMFERLVKLDMPYTMLNMQRRMTPVLREILNPFYPALQDHPVVCRPEARPPVPGMSYQSFFFHHTWSEGVDENLSKFNILEAEMVVRFIDYLLMNGVKPEEITVLTFYRGQRKKLLSEFRKMPHRAPFRNVHTVDSYQGEENDIVILSLVRSNGPNGPHNAGFLRDGNRGVVSISRARRGFYIFGNMENLLHACEESRSMWGKVQEVFYRQNRFGFDGKLPITCQQHSNTSWISHPDDWINNHGGCTEPCREKLECGHDCGRYCHWVDHSRLICQKPCERKLTCNHLCQNLCGDECKCSCAAFTGAYPNDESWDDSLAVDGSHEYSSVSNSCDAPFIGSGGPIGRLRQGRLTLKDHRGPHRHAHRSVQAVKQARPWELPVRPNMVGHHGVQFYAQPQDEGRQQMYRQSAEAQSSNLIHDQASSQSALDTMQPIRETFRQVTISPHGMRNVQGGIVADTGRTPSPQDISEASRGNELGSAQVQDPRIPLNSRYSMHTAYGVGLNEIPPYSIVKPRAVRPNSVRTVLTTIPQPQADINGREPDGMRNRNDTANWIGSAHQMRPIENRPEWEASSLVHEAHNGNTDPQPQQEEGKIEENLIDL